MMLLSEINKLLGGEMSGEDAEIHGVSKIEDAPEGTLTFLSNLKYKRHLSTTRAAAVLLASGAEFPELGLRKKPIAVIRVTDPYISFLHLIDLFHPPAAGLPKGIHPSCVIGTGSTIGEDTAIGANVVIGNRVVIGRRAAIHPNCTLGDDVRIGDDSVLYPNCAIREQCSVGERAVIHSGAVIGSDGFGFAPKPDGSYEKIPQRGNVIIEDDVEIGANCTIDRATIGSTRIKKGSKLDNLIHVAHNVRIGENTVIAAQTGISGSSTVGNSCQIGGQVGLTGHISIADRTTIGAQSGVPKSITEEGKIYFGYPAREIHETWRIEGALRQLPQLLYDFRDLQKKIEELAQTISSSDKNKKIE